MNVPLEKRTVDFLDGVSKKVEPKSVLDPCWKVDGKFTTYKPLPSVPKSAENNALYEEWLARLKCIDSDLEWLLGLSYGRFWCQIIHDYRFHRCLDSYIRYAPRFYDNDENLDSDPEIKSVHASVHRRVFLTCLRMGTYHESKENRMSTSAFADIIYENFLFDIPMMMDLCVLYGKSNGPLLTKLIANVFNNQPKYNQDLDGAILAVLQVFDTIAAQCDVADASVELPPKLERKQTQSLSSQSDKVVCDLVDYVFDVSHTLWMFAQIYEPAIDSYRAHHIHTKIAWFYNNVIPVLKESVTGRDFAYQDGVDIKGRVKYRLSQSRGLLVRLVRKVIFTRSIQKILDIGDSGKGIGDLVELYLTAFTSLLNEKKFIHSYESMFPFQDDMEIVSHTAYKIDPPRLAYIQEALSLCSEDTRSKRRKPRRKDLKFTPSDDDVSYMKKKKKSGVIKFREGYAVKPDRPETEVAGGGAGMAAGGGAFGAEAGAAGGDLESMGACAAAVTGIELESLISAVRDILPDLGDGFIERCLDEYNFDQSAVVDAILTDNLRPNVRDLDRSLPRRKPEVVEQSLVNDRLNVFDNDEFDVFRRPNDVDLSRVTRGKKQEGEESLSMVLDDHTDVERYRESFVKYTVIDEEGDGALDRFADVYDDEYDDTYDSADVGAMLDADEIEETFKIQPLNEKKAPRTYHQPEDEENQESESGRPRDQFCADPAKIREQQAQRRASQQRGRGRGRGQGQGRGQAADGGATEKKHDVVGRQKGQGQDNSVLKNRNYKDKNKSRIGNHNRRAMADRKKAKGMF